MQSGLIKALYEKLTKPATMSNDEGAKLGYFPLESCPKGKIIACETSPQEPLTNCLYLIKELVSFVHGERN